MSALHLHIYGRVQGVGFRESMRRQAERLGINGWVHNCADGSVETVIAGDETAIAAMLNWCHAGPPLAQVRKVEHMVTDAHFSGFIIDRIESGRKQAKKCPAREPGVESTREEDWRR